MRTALECLPCFLKQTLFTARLASRDPALQQEIMTEVIKFLPELDHRLSPPENSIPIYELIYRLSNCPDPFKELKKKSNRLALDMAVHLANKVEAASDPLLDAIKLAIAGNIIDYGAHHEFDLDGAIQESLDRNPTVNHYNVFQQDIQKADSVLYLADNCGELVFDGLVLKQLIKKNTAITLAVKEKPIINDALLLDAKECGIDKYAILITNGTSCPGTPLRRCSKEFQEVFAKADLIISKGQGNFETLSEISAPIYFLLTIKCPVVSRHVSDLLGARQPSVSTGDRILMRTPHWPTQR